MLRETDWHRNRETKRDQRTETDRQTDKKEWNVNAAIYRRFDSGSGVLILRSKHKLVANEWVSIRAERNLKVNTKWPHNLLWANSKCVFLGGQILNLTSIWKCHLHTRTTTSHWRSAWHAIQTSDWCLIFGLTTLFNFSNIATIGIVIKHLFRRWSCWFYFENMVLL